MRLGDLSSNKAIHRMLILYQYYKTMEKPKVLSETEIQEELKQLEGWSFADNQISKEFQFADFVGSLSFINRLVAYFQEMDHHPDTHIFYSKVKFELQRFDSGEKVTDRDILVAHKIEETYKTENKL
jgi:4a-hydroxytetrahydrobiopterin dehydratase